MTRFAEKVVVITGAGRGIGYQTALLFAREGAKVVVNDLGGAPDGTESDASIAAQAAEKINASGGAAVAETSSIDGMSGAQSLIECAMDNFGRVDYLINNAGIVRPKPVAEMTEEDFDRVLAVNLKGYFATVRHAAAHLKKQGGAIVNLSTPSGWGHWGMSNYSAAKEGVVGFTRSIARELGEFGVRVNAVRPIATDSDRFSLELMETVRYQIEELKIPHLSNQWINPGDNPRAANVAAAIGWLCTDASAALNGREICIWGNQIALVQEPEIIRSQFDAEGWTFDRLCTKAVSHALTYDIQNRYLGKKQ